MKMQDIKQIAKGMGLKAGVGKSKQDLIRDIQIAEGNSPCFKNITDCGIMNCLWRDDCQTPAK